MPKKSAKNWEMEISITPAGEEPSQCRCCGRWVPSDYCPPLGGGLGKSRTSSSRPRGSPSAKSAL